MDLFARSLAANAERDEVKKRRQLRMAQVRKQTMDWNREAGQQFQQVKAKEVENLIDKATEEAQADLNEVIDEMIKYHDEGMKEIGKAHDAVIDQPDYEKIAKKKAKENRRKALRRFRVALAQERSEQAKRDEAASKLLNVRTLIFQEAASRAKSLPRPSYIRKMLSRPPKFTNRPRVITSSRRNLNSTMNVSTLSVTRRRRKKKLIKPKNIIPSPPTTSAIRKDAMSRKEQKTRPWVRITATKEGGQKTEILPGFPFSPPKQKEKISKSVAKRAVSGLQTKEKVVLSPRAPSTSQKKDHGRKRHRGKRRKLEELPHQGHEASESARKSTSRERTRKPVSGDRLTNARKRKSHRKERYSDESLREVSRRKSKRLAPESGKSILELMADSRAKSVNEVDKQEPPSSARQTSGPPRPSKLHKAEKHRRKKRHRTKSPTSPSTESGMAKAKRIYVSKHDKAESAKSAIPGESRHKKKATKHKKDDRAMSHEASSVHTIYTKQLKPKINSDLPTDEESQGGVKLLSLQRSSHARDIQVERNLEKPVSVSDSEGSIHSAALVSDHDQSHEPKPKSGDHATKKKGKTKKAEKVENVSKKAEVPTGKPTRNLPTTSAKTERPTGNKPETVYSRGRKLERVTTGKNVAIPVPQGKQPEKILPSKKSSMAPAETRSGMETTTASPTATKKTERPAADSDKRTESAAGSSSRTTTKSQIPTDSKQVKASTESAIKAKATNSLVPGPGPKKTFAKAVTDVQKLQKVTKPKTSQRYVPESVKPSSSGARPTKPSSSGTRPIKPSSSGARPTKPSSSGTREEIETNEKKSVLQMMAESIHSEDQQLQQEERIEDSTILSNVSDLGESFSDNSTIHSIDLAGSDDEKASETSKQYERQFTDVGQEQELDYSREEEEESRNEFNDVIYTIGSNDEISSLPDSQEQRQIIQQEKQPIAFSSDEKGRKQRENEKAEERNNSETGESVHTMSGQEGSPIMTNDSKKSQINKEQGAIHSQMTDSDDDYPSFLNDSTESRLHDIYGSDLSDDEQANETEANPTKGKSSEDVQLLNLEQSSKSSKKETEIKKSTKESASRKSVPSPKKAQNPLASQVRSNAVKSTAKKNGGFNNQNIDSTQSTVQKKVSDSEGMKPKSKIPISRERKSGIVVTKEAAAVAASKPASTTGERKLERQANFDKESAQPDEQEQSSERRKLIKDLQKRAAEMVAQEKKKRESKSESTKARASSSEGINARPPLHVHSNGRLFESVSSVARDSEMGLIGEVRQSTGSTNQSPPKLTDRPATSTPNTSSTDKKTTQAPGVPGAKRASSSESAASSTSVETVVPLINVTTESSAPARVPLTESERKLSVTTPETARVMRDYIRQLLEKSPDTTKILGMDTPSSSTSSSSHASSDSSKIVINTSGDDSVSRNATTEHVAKKLSKKNLPQTLSAIPERSDEDKFSGPSERSTSSATFATRSNGQTSDDETNASSLTSDSTNIIIKITKVPTNRDINSSNNTTFDERYGSNESLSVTLDALTKHQEDFLRQEGSLKLPSPPVYHRPNNIQSSRTNVIQVRAGAAGGSRVSVPSSSQMPGPSSSSTPSRTRELQSESSRPRQLQSESSRQRQLQSEPSRPRQLQNESSRPRQHQSESSRPKQKEKQKPTDKKQK